MAEQKAELNIEISLVDAGELDGILPIYDYARAFMRKTGNPTQWAGGYPSKEVLENDILKNQLYAIKSNGKIAGVFVFFVGKEPTYDYIEGAWSKNASEAGVIHRVASNGTIKGMFKLVADFCLSQTNYLRIDTHKDNSVMQSTLKKNGFTHCGRIYLENGDPREAFDKVKE